MSRSFWTSARRRAPERSTSGFGLRLVAEIADRWGVLSRDPTRVWFTIDL